MAKDEARFRSALETAFADACADAAAAMAQMGGAGDALEQRARDEVSLAFLKTSIDALFGPTAGLGQRAVEQVRASSLGAAAVGSQHLPSLRVNYNAARDVLGAADRRALKRYESAVVAMAASVAAEMDLARRERSLSSQNPEEGVYHDWSVIQSAEAALRRAAASAYLDALPAMVAESGASDVLVGAVRDMAMVNLGELQASDLKDGWCVRDLRDANGVLIAVDVTMDDDSCVRYAVGSRPRGVKWTFWNYQRALSEISSADAPAKEAIGPKAAADASGDDVMDS